MSLEKSRQIIKSINEKGSSVETEWTPAHISIAGNELADQLAKEAVREASTVVNRKAEGVLPSKKSERPAGVWNTQMMKL